MKHLIIVLFGLLNMNPAMSAIFKKVDQDKGCTSYYQIDMVKNAEGKYELPKLGVDEKLVTKDTVYNMSFFNMRVDFDNKEILGNLQINRTLGRNRIIRKNIRVSGDKKVSEKLINYYFNKICIDDQGEVIDADIFIKKGH